MKKNKRKKRWLPKAEYHFIYGKKVPRLCVEVIARTTCPDIDMKSRMGLMVAKRGIPPRKGYWHLPGVTLLRGESVEEAILRCAREELGVLLKQNKDASLLSRFLGYWEYPTRDGFGQAVSLVFEVVVKRFLKKGELERGPGAPEDEVRVVQMLPTPFIPSQRQMLERLWASGKVKQNGELVFR
jgi:ADP-ribose pyrophosphatase YjhB (NUDIX family)